MMTGENVRVGDILGTAYGELVTTAEMKALGNWNIQSGYVDWFARGTILLIEMDGVPPRDDKTRRWFIRDFDTGGTQDIMFVKRTWNETEVNAVCDVTPLNPTWSQQMQYRLVVSTTKPMGPQTVITVLHSKGNYNGPSSNTFVPKSKPKDKDPKPKKDKDSKKSDKAASGKRKLTSDTASESSAKRSATRSTSQASSSARTQGIDLSEAAKLVQSESKTQALTAISHSQKSKSLIVKKSRF